MTITNLCAVGWGSCVKHVIRVIRVQQQTQGQSLLTFVGWSLANWPLMDMS